MSIILTRLASGGYKITQSGGLTKHISHLGYDSDYNSDRTAIQIFLVNKNGGVESGNFGFSDWTIDAVSGFTDIEAVASALDALGVGFAPPSGGGGGGFNPGNGIIEDGGSPGTYDLGGTLTKAITYLLGASNTISMSGNNGVNSEISYSINSSGFNVAAYNVVTDNSVELSLNNFNIGLGTTSNGGDDSQSILFSESKTDIRSIGALSRQGVELTETNIKFTSSQGSVTSENLNIDLDGLITAIGATIDPSGEITSIRQAFGIHLQGLIAGDSEPFFKIESAIQGRGLSSKITLGPGGSTPGDIEIARLGINTLGLVIDGAIKWSTNEDTLLLQSGVPVSFIDTPVDPVNPTGSIIKTYNKGGFLTQLDSVGISRRLALDKRVTVSSALDLATIDGTKEYFIDGNINMNGTSSIDTSNGCLINGYGFDVSKITCTDDNYTLFESIASGDVFINNCTIEITGTNSKVFGLAANTGMEAVELDRVRFDNCTDLGYLDGFRQGLETGTGRFGGSPSLEFRGVWLGGYFMQASIFRFLNNTTYSLFSSAVGQSFASRFGGNPNMDTPLNVTAFDFVEGNFLGDDLFQLDGANFQGTGTVTTIPVSSPKIRISSSRGTENTFVGAYWEISTEVSTVMAPATLTKVLGTTTFSDLVWFSGTGDNELTYLSTEKTKVRAHFLGTFVSGNNKTFTLVIRKYDSSALSYTDISTIDFTTSGSGNFNGVNLITPLTEMDENDRIEMWISGDGTDGTMANNSKLIIEEAVS